MTASGVGAEGAQKVLDIVERLNVWARYRIGDMPPTPNGDHWGSVLTADLKDAIAEIERLRSLVGAARDGMSLADIKHELGVKTA